MSIISACSATKGYDGPTRSSDELATVKAFGVEFYFVNGKAVSATSSGLSLLPGHNQIEFTVNASNFNAAQDGKKRMILNVNLEAGKTYAVTGPRGGGGLCAYPLNSAGDPIYEEPAGCLGDS
jgi:hypothetical protein